MADLYQNEPLDPTKAQQPQVDNLGTPGSYTLQDAQSRLNQWTTQQYGQTLNDQQWQQLGGAMFKPQRQRVGAGGKAAERARGNSLFKAMRQSGSAYNCGNSRKECNVHHFCSHRRGPG